MREAALSLSCSQGSAKPASRVCTMRGVLSFANGKRVEFSVDGSRL